MELTLGHTPIMLPAADGRVNACGCGVREAGSARSREAGNWTNPCGGK